MPPSTRRNTFTPLEPHRKRPTAAVGPRPADVESSPAQPLLLLAAVAALAATVVGCRPAPPPLPTPWPEQFHAVVITNLPGGGRRPAAAADRHLLRLAARTRPESSPAVAVACSWASCGPRAPPTCSTPHPAGHAFHCAVGLLPLNWKARRAACLGRDRVDGFD